MYLSEVPLYGTGRLGMMLFAPGPETQHCPTCVKENTLNTGVIATRRVGAKLYELTDHLGNVRAVIGDVKLADGGSFKVDLKSYTNYYPYGMEQPQRAWRQGEDYRYGYNGVEEDDELKGEGNSLSTYYRLYDPRLALWLGIDPVVHESQSPYSAMDANPVLLTDPKGDKTEFTVDGIKVYDDGVKNGLTVEATKEVIGDHMDTGTLVDWDAVRNDQRSTVTVTNQSLNEQWRKDFNEKLEQEAKSRGWTSGRAWVDNRGNGYIQPSATATDLLLHYIEYHGLDIGLLETLFPSSERYPIISVDALNTYSGIASPNGGGIDFRPLDWTHVGYYRSPNEDAKTHVRKHERDDPSKSEHSVFYYDAIRKTESAWLRAYYKGDMPISSNSRQTVYDIPMGYNIGRTGSTATPPNVPLQTIMIVFMPPNSTTVKTAYPFR